jgi:hypothetical protein
MSEPLQRTKEDVDRMIHILNAVCHANLHNDRLEGALEALYWVRGDDMTLERLEARIAEVTTRAE